MWTPQTAARCRKPQPAPAQTDYLMICKAKIQFIVTDNHECKETISINCVQSSLKSEPLWVTL